MQCTKDNALEVLCLLVHDGDGQGRFADAAHAQETDDVTTFLDNPSTKESLFFFAPIKGGGG